MISPKVMSELLEAKLVPTQFTVPKPGEHAWSPAEQRRFWEAIQRFPQGPWTAIAAYVGSKSTRQAMTHGQKLRQKLNRWKRRVRSDSVGSVGSNSSASASGRTPPLSPQDYDDSAAMDHMEDEDGERNDWGESVSDARAVKVERKEEMRYFGDYLQALDVHDDRYLEHLLSDIEPVLENVAHFTTGSPCNYTHLSRPMITPTHDTEHAAWLTRHPYVVSREHKPTTWHQHPHAMYYPHQHQYHSTSTSVPLHATHEASYVRNNKTYHL